MVVGSRVLLTIGPTDHLNILNGFQLRPHLGGWYSRDHIRGPQLPYPLGGVCRLLAAVPCQDRNWFLRG